MLTLAAMALAALASARSVKRIATPDQRNPPGTPADHFLCYHVKDTAVPKFASVPGVSLTDQFGTGQVTVTKVMTLCTPTNKMGQGIVDTATHLEGYAIKSAAKPVKQRGLRIVNQFGEVVVDALKPTSLLVPTAKSLTAVPPPPGPNNVDHYQCYMAKTPKGQPKFVPISDVSLADQFGARTYDLKKPAELCAPVSKNGEGIIDPTGHFLCYVAKLTKKRPPQAPVPSVPAIHVTNQFGSGELTTKTVTELCVPSLKNPPASTTTSVTTTSTTSTTSTTLFPPPTITDFNPKTASIGDTVTITGNHFMAPSGAGPQVTMAAQSGGTMAAPLGPFGATSIVIVVPAGAASGPLTVTVAGQSATSAASLTIRPASDFTLSVTPGSADVIQGQSISYAVSLSTTNGFSQLASLGMSGLPAGLSGSFNHPLLAAGQTALLTLTAPATQPLGTGTFTVTASATVQGFPEVQAVNASVTVQRLTMSFLGRTVVDDPTETPLAGVTITFLGVDFQGHPTGCSGQAVSDAAGNFMIANLPSPCVGTQLIRYDGSTVTSPAGTYAGVDLLYTFTPGQVTTAPVLIHLPRVDDAETVMVQQNASTDQTFTFRSIPGLSVTVYAGTTFTLADGTQPNRFPLIAVQVPVDRLPDQMPQGGSTIMPFIVAFQPANTTASQPVAVTFPNTLNTAPGTNMPLDTLDPTKGVMVQYGTGTVSSDGTQIIPDPDPSHPMHRYGLVHFDWHGPRVPAANQTNPSPDCTGGCFCAQAGSHPVDLSSGLEVLTVTDIAISGSRGSISIARTYRSGSNNPGPFGIGTGHNYSYQLNVQNQSQGLITLIMPDGNQFPLNSTDERASFANSTIPSLLGAVLTAPSTGTYLLRWKNGTTYAFQTINTFSNFTPLTSITDANGNVTSLVFGPNPYPITQIIDPVGRSLNLTYDGSNRIISIVDPIGRTVTYTYNAQGTLGTVTDPLGGVTAYEYDAQNRLTKVTDPRGRVVAQNTYDPETGRVVQQTQADGGVLTFNYISECAIESPGQTSTPPTCPVALTSVTDPLGNQTTYQFNPLGFLVAVTDALGQMRTFTRDPGTNLVLGIHGGASCSVCGAGTSGDQTFTYDTRGNLLTRTDALGNTTTFTYDPAFGKIASITDPLGNATTFTYDGGGNFLRRVDANGHAIAVTYDSTGLPGTISDPLGSTVTLSHNSVGDTITAMDQLGNITAAQYDGISRPVEITDALGRRTGVVYDALNRIVKVEDAAGHTRAFAYDLGGNVVSVTDGQGNVRSFTYDAFNRLLTETTARGLSDSRTYDLNGNVTKFVDRRGQVGTFTYDSPNRLVGENYQDGTTVGRSYDSNGRLLQVLDSSGGPFSFQYDLAERLTSAASQFGVLTYILDAAGRVTSRQVSGQPAVTYTYDAVGNVLQAATTSAAAALTYDGRNAIVGIPRLNGVALQYPYDVLGRLSSVTHSNAAGTLAAQSYDYDAVGNRIAALVTGGQTIPAASGPRTYDADDKLLQDGATTYSYDGNGNLASAVDPSGTTTYTWDARNRLESLTVADGATMNFVYDFARNLIEIRRSGTAGSFAQQFVVDDVWNTALIGTSAGDQATVLSGRGIDEHLAVVHSNGHVEYALADGLNSTVQTANEHGGLVASFAYEPFGETTLLTGPEYPFEYTGRTRVLPDLYYYRARFYSPTVERFVTEDPSRFGFTGGDPNLYRYVRNAPTMLVDPLGLVAPPAPGPFPPNHQPYPNPFGPACTIATTIGCPLAGIVNPLGGVVCGVVAVFACQAVGGKPVGINGPQDAWSVATSFVPGARAGFILGLMCPGLPEQFAPPSPNPFQCTLEPS